MPPKKPKKKVPTSSRPRRCFFKKAIKSRVIALTIEMVGEKKYAKRLAREEELKKICGAALIAKFKEPPVEAYVKARNELIQNQLVILIQLLIFAKHHKKEPPEVVECIEQDLAVLIASQNKYLREGGI